MPSPAQVTAVRGDLLAWFREAGRSFTWRDKSSTPEHRLVATLLLQRTAAARVDVFLPSFLTRYPGWSALAATPERELEAFLAPIGLSKRRAVTLKALGTALTARAGVLPHEEADIAKLPGLGQYGTNAVLLYYWNERRPLIDGTVARTLTRLFGILRTHVDYRYDPGVQKIGFALVQCGSPVEVNWAILDIGSQYCLTRHPRCSECPLRSRCVHNLASQVEQL